MDEQLFENLLYRSESETLDFKRDQYLFAGASDEQQSELLKDVLAFANAWRESDAYILIGVRDSPPKATVIGISQHLQDHSLQQFVNRRVQRPIRFNYEPFTFETKQFGIIKIPAGQERPFFLRKKFGDVEVDTVYVRRGSSTALADPDEIARMGASAIRRPRPAFRIEVIPVALPEVPGGDDVGPRYFLKLGLINFGDASAIGTIVEVPQDLYYFGLNLKIWEDLTGPSGGLTFTSKMEFHPGHGDLVCLVDAGPVEVDMTKITTQPGSVIPESEIRFAAKYPQTKMTLNVRVLCKDHPPSSFSIELSKAEMEGEQMKAFEAS